MRLNLLSKQFRKHNLLGEIFRPDNYLLPAAFAATACDHQNQHRENTFQTRANPGILFGRGMAYREAGRYAEAQQDFQRILELKCVNGPDLLFSVAELELGRVYQKQNDIPKARIAYQNFLLAWKDADPDVPLLHAAKSEYAKLQ